MTTFTRRQFLGRTVLLTATSVLAACKPKPSPIATETPTSAPTTATQTQTTTPLPPIEVIALNRMAFGPRPGDLDYVRQIGFEAYVEEQLNPNDDDDPLATERLSQATLHIAYDGNSDYEGVDEDRPLFTLDQPLNKLWPLTNWEIPADYAERVRPGDETIVATWIRAVYSKWQLRELLVDFWHNHFNVNMGLSERLAAIWPIYDREVIRQHCLGNFRAFLEAVAQSQPMLYYLDNASSKASPANENYARELFELHTLGADNYYNDLYNRWRDVPGAEEGQPIGYIDQDVYEAARAFTGWTVADGSYSEAGELPNTGEFYYHEAWHDPYQKRVLGVEFDANQPPLADGRKVLDLVATHPATAHHLCTKLCRRLVADDPPQSLVDQAVATWMAAQAEPDQIKQTVRTILLSPEFAATWGQKVKRPLELLASFLRATNVGFRPSMDIFWIAGNMGQWLFNWVPPTGHPDRAGYWLSTNVTLNRWNTLLYLLADWHSMVEYDWWGQHPAGVTTSRQIVDFWLERLLGRPVADDVYQALLDFLRQERGPDVPPGGENDQDLNEKLANLVVLIAMMPDFQWR